MRWLIDSDILIEGERGNPLFEAWSRSEGEFATADVIRTEFLLGVHAVADSVKFSLRRLRRDWIVWMTSGVRGGKRYRPLSLQGTPASKPARRNS